MHIDFGMTLLAAQPYQHLFTPRTEEQMADGRAREILLEVRMTFGRAPHPSVHLRKREDVGDWRAAAKEEPLNDLTLTLARLGRPQRGGRKISVSWAVHVSPQVTVREIPNQKDWYCNFITCLTLLG